MFIGIDNGIQFENSKVAIVWCNQIEDVNELLIYQRNDLSCIPLFDAHRRRDSTGCIYSSSDPLQTDIHGLLFLVFKLLAFNESH